MLPYDLIGENGRQLINRGRIVEEISRLSWKRGAMISKKPSKGSKKVWEEFAQWSITQNVKTVKDLKKEYD